MTNDPTSVSGKCPPSRLELLEEENARLKVELEQSRETNRRLNNRCQIAEKAANEKVRTHPTPTTLGRGLANYAAATYRRERDEARGDARRVLNAALHTSYHPGVLGAALTVIANRPWRDEAESAGREEA